MLPTNEKANKGIYLSTATDSILKNKLEYCNFPYGKETHSKIKQHLYILSDDEIKEWDWYYWSVTNTIQKAIKDSLGRLPKIEDGSKKIIATTDSSLRTGILQEGSRIEHLPQLPQSFIEYFISQYNKGNIITEVMVEYEEPYKNLVGSMVGSNIGHFILTEENKYRLKINSNNTINTKPIKDSWNREEVIELFNKCNKDLRLLVGYRLPKWIEQNL